ncbi:FAD-binding and (Fe-S)-binding domain-containing protein [Flavobacteriaceae bacterium 14752]|uniref:FAD-binding and (Fe-S)-binding domain-containing protein n=1 Tax=Mesohalobacter salilacus TaxID=2491711 RepID=UPI000F6342E0|nr:FAD-binding oxidoreductase [Flavobacteriaceae bacterium 14752]
MNVETLVSSFSGDIKTDALHQSIYATDASVYQQRPTAVAIPKSKGDLKQLIKFASEHNTSLIPRAAGTSLAGQCVGSGIVVDTGKYFTQILKINAETKTVILQPGVIRDELNLTLKPYNLFFGPNTSTSNRCMIGGMVGNNSSGTTSIQYGTTRDKVISLKCILSDAEEVHFKTLSKEEFISKTKLNTTEGKIYSFFWNLVNKAELIASIKKSYPKKNIHRRNTGYALDDVVEQYQKTQTINLARFICGSEGTLGFITEIELQLDDLPPKHSALVAAHFKTINETLSAVKTIMQHNLYACEMMDDTILDCTKNHLEYKDYRFFINGEPKAILFLELKAESEIDLSHKVEALAQDLRNKTACYSQPVLKVDDINKAFNLRKAGLGLLGSIVGDEKAVACIEDTAVSLEDLDAYISDFAKLMKNYNQEPVYYAHAGAGELHLRPILNLKTQKGVEDFVSITHEVAKLVKQYKGSLSGEHGDGIVRSNFIELMLGETCYEMLKGVKSTFDPKVIFNPGKIVNPYPIDKNFRYESNSVAPEIDSFLNFNIEKNLLRAAENCNGSGDCRKTELSAGSMCPSYHATKNEQDTTRARANALRQYLTDPSNLSDKAIKEVFDLCISCKACKRECPSNVDAASFKAEWTHQYYKTHKRPIRDILIGFNDSINKTFQPLAGAYNYFVQHKFWSKTLKNSLGFHQKRSLPQLSQQTFIKYLNKNKRDLKLKKPKIKTIYLFVDEFTNRLESEIGRDAVELLTHLGYEVKYLKNKPSGRALISKGFLKQAKALAEYNINLFKDVVDESTPLIGIEPSAILGFRDDYLRLTDQTETAKKLSKNTLLIEEFLSQEIQQGNITSSHFSDIACEVKLHIHCHQKALSNSKITFDVINVVKNAKVSIIPSGCCGMAGGFGYEKEHYEISMKIGELILLPAVRKSKPQTYILANGSSCRHQIKDGSSKRAIHPVSFLRQMLK